MIVNGKEVAYSEELIGRLNRIINNTRKTIALDADRYTRGLRFDDNEGVIRRAITSLEKRNKELGRTLDIEDASESLLTTHVIEGLRDAASCDYDID